MRYNRVTTVIAQACIHYKFTTMFVTHVLIRKFAESPTLNRD